MDIYTSYIVALINLAYAGSIVSHYELFKIGLSSLHVCRMKIFVDICHAFDR